MGNSRRYIKDGFLKSCFIISLLVGFAANMSFAASDNAALFYYQALINCPKEIPFTDDERRIISSDHEISKELRQKLRLHRMLILKPVDVGTEIEYCDWGLATFGDGFEVIQGRPQRLASSVADRFLMFRGMAMVDARFLWRDGDYPGAFRRCLTLRKLARHLGQEVDLAGLAWVYGEGVYCVLSGFLGSKSVDPQTLLWLREQLSAEVDTSEWPINAIRGREKRCFQSFTISLKKGRLRKYRNDSSPECTDVFRAKQKIYNRLSDKEFFELVQQRNKGIMDDIHAMLSNMRPPYEPIHQKLNESFVIPISEEQEKRNDPLLITVVPFDEVITPIYQFFELETKMNALRAAIEIYLLKSQTGKLPEAIPMNVPKSPYKEQAFKYEVTDDGFVLSYSPDWWKGSLNRRPRDLNFKVSAD